MDPRNTEPEEAPEPEEQASPAPSADDTAATDTFPPEQAEAAGAALLSEKAANKAAMRSARQTYTTVGLAMCVLILASYLASGLIQTIVYLVSPTLYESAVFLLIAGTVPMYLFGFLPAALIIRRLPRASLTKNRVSVRMYLLFFVICYGMQVIGQILSSNTLNLLEWITGHSFDFQLNDTVAEAPVFVTILFSVVLAPVIEELFFRKLLIDRLAPIGGFGAVLVSAIIFGLFHGNFYQAFYATGLGLIFGWIYLYSGGNILYSISLHVLFNLLGGVLVPKLTEILGIGTEQGITGDIIAAHPVAFLLYLLYFAFLLTALIITWICLAVKKRNIRESLDAYPSPITGDGSRIGAVFSNPGVPLMGLLFLIMFWLSAQ